jgi:RNA polymerase sigma-70 factor (ECF subfamily)
MTDSVGKALELKELEIGAEQAPSGSDNDLVRDFIAGNDAAFTQLVSKYKNSITNYLSAMVGDYEAAVDLAQETFLRVYRNIGRYSHFYQFSTWIYRIATNLAIDEMRYRRRRGRVFYRNVWRRPTEEVESQGLEISDARKGPGDEILRKESGRVLRDAIRSLPEKYRIAFIMKEIQDMPYDSIAEALGCSAGTVKSRLHRARELLQRKLEHYL